MKWENLCSVCTYGTPAMIGARSGFSKRVKELAPGATSVHWMIHRQALEVKLSLQTYNQH